MLRLRKKIATPLGPLWVTVMSKFCLRAVEWEEYSERHYAVAGHPLSQEGYERIATNPCGLSDKLREYFAGNLALLIRFPSHGDRAISAKSGKHYALSPLAVMHYGQLVEQLGRVLSAARAVGAANDQIPSASSYLAIGLLAETAP